MRIKIDTLVVKTLTILEQRILKAAIRLTHAIEKSLL